LAYIAAGPLEDLLKRHGARFWDSIQKKGRSDPKVLRALSGVWMQPDDQIFNRWRSFMEECGFTDGRRTPL
jgi:hypothetical protein